MANDDQAKGTAKDIGGKIKEKIGELTGKTDLKEEGLADRAEGKVQKGVGDTKDKI